MNEFDNMMQPLMAMVSEVQADAQRMREELNKVSRIAAAAVNYVAARTRTNQAPVDFCPNQEVMDRYFELADTIMGLK